MNNLITKKPRTTLTKPSEVFVALLILVAFIGGCYLGSSCSYKWNVVPLKSQAIEKGYAEWQVIDPINGHTKFVWKSLENKTIATSTFTPQ